MLSQRPIVKNRHEAGYHSARVDAVSPAAVEEAGGRVHLLGLAEQWRGVEDGRDRPENWQL